MDNPSAWFSGKTVEGFCPGCTPHFDFASRKFVAASAPPDPAAEAAPAPLTPAQKFFDRSAHCTRIGQIGGMTTFERYGSAHMRAIGKAGYATAVKAHGVGYVDGLLTAKRWDGLRRPEVLADLATGRVPGQLDRAA